MNTLVFRLLGCVLAAVLLGSCTAPLPAETPSSRASSPAPTAAASSIPSKEAETMTIQLQVNGRTFAATLEQNNTARALAQRLQNYGGFEKVGPLGESLPANDRQTTTHAGDIVLYQGDQIVLFYGSNSWSYTRLGRVNNLTGWADALGRGNVTVTFSLAE
ncbi:hypothetical protein B5G28_01985 [Faecalibacterium sp. An77]|nr:hypothetical protein B5G28_01985 [Faecalibacterium sp. An77]